MTGRTVCMLTASFAETRGGAERQCRLLSEHLVDAGVDVTVLTRKLRDGDSAAPRRVAVRRLPVGGSGRLAGFAFALAGACWLATRRGRFGILHAHQALSPALAAVLAKRMRPDLRVVVKVACSGAWSDFRLARGGPFYRPRMAMLRWVDRFVVLNRESVEELRAVGLADVPCQLIPNGVDVGCFSPPPMGGRATLRARLGLPADATIALFVGRLEQRKGLDILLAAWAELDRRHAAPQLVIVGDGDATPWSRDARRLAIENRVHFLGERKEVADFYRAADLFVFPSRAEGCPNAVLEAMACGLPVVATDVAGNREVLGEDDKTGRLVPMGHPEALAEAVSTLATSPALRSELGATARAVILKRYDIRRVASQYLSLYADLLSRPGSGGTLRD